jgi:hypothetical protein
LLFLISHHQKTHNKSTNEEQLKSMVKKKNC